MLSFEGTVILPTDTIVDFEDLVTNGTAFDLEITKNLTGNPALIIKVRKP